MKLGRLVRVSSEGQERRELSLPEQRRLTESACLKYGYLDSPLFDEHATSTSLPLSQRPVLTQLRIAIESGELAGLSLVRLDRLARPVGTEGLREAAEILEWLVASKCLILCTGLSRDLAACTLFDMANTTDVRRVRDELLKSGDEKELMKERLAVGMRRIEEQGKWRGGQMPYWYTYESAGRSKKPMLAIVPERADLVRFCFEQYLKTPNYARVVEALNSHPVFSSMRQTPGLSWSRISVVEFLSNPRAAGFDQYGASSGKRSAPSALVKSATWEPIVDLATWSTVQQLRKARQPATKQTVKRHPLTAILRCATCDGPMWIKPRGNVGEGRTWSALYFCNNKGCAHRQAISSKLAHQVALDWAVKILASYRDRPTIVDVDVAEKVAYIEQQLTALDSTQSRLTWALVNAGLPEAEFIAQQAIINNRRAELQSSMSRVKADNILGGDPIGEQVLSLDIDTAPIEQVFSIYQSIILERVSHMKYQPTKIILTGGQTYSL